MSIELVPCHKDRDFFICLAQEYVKELRQYDDRIEWDESVWNRAVWDAQFIVDGRILCGFVCSNVVQFKNKPKLLFIDEFYVSPDERHRGVGIGALESMVGGKRGDVGLYILDRNVPAKGFWDAVEKELGWERADRPEIRKEDGCELRVYRLPEGK